MPQRLHPQWWVSRPPHPGTLLLYRRRVSGIKEIFEQFLPPHRNIFSWSQHYSTCNTYSAGRALLSPSESPDGSAESLRQSKSLFPWPLQIPHTSQFLFQPLPNHIPLGLLVPTTRSHSQSGTSYARWQIVGILCFRVPNVSLHYEIGKLRKHENRLEWIYTCTFVFLKSLWKMTI